MKKLMLTTVFAFAVVLTSCGSDDDAGKNCRECEVIGLPLTICDNGDGTVTTTAAGQSETSDLPDGVTFEQFAETACSNTITIGQ